MTDDIDNLILGLINKKFLIHNPKNDTLNVTITFVKKILDPTTLAICKNYDEALTFTILRAFQPIKDKRLAELCVIMNCYTTKQIKKLYLDSRKDLNDLR